MCFAKVNKLSLFRYKVKKIMSYHKALVALIVSAVIFWTLGSVSMLFINVIGIKDLNYLLIPSTLGLGFYTSMISIFAYLLWVFIKKIFIHIQSYLRG